ncbi:MAG: M24 family metallopeptidase [Thermoanaerobaculia bacterium]|nr:M24 family metallopeptidase [Thermoanaerobaculia bacterium]
MRPVRKEPSPLVVNPADVDAAYDAAQRVVEIHRRLSAWLRIGVTLPKVNRFVETALDDLGCRSCFRGYRVGQHPPFPSQACLSVNDCIVHGTAGYYSKPIASGDLLKIDIGVTYKGWVGDAVKTYVFGEPSAETLRLTECGKEATRRGILELQPGRPLVGWRAPSRAVSRASTDFSACVVSGVTAMAASSTSHPTSPTRCPKTKTTGPMPFCPASPGCCSPSSR